MRHQIHVLFALLLLLLNPSHPTYGADESHQAMPQSLSDLSGSRVGVFTGSTNDLNLTKTMPDVELHRFDDHANMIQALETGRVDAILIDSTLTFEAHLPERGMTIAFSGFSRGDAAVGFRHDEQELCDSFNVFLNAIREDGTYDEIIDRWVSNGVEGVKMPALPPAEGPALNIAIEVGNVPFGFQTVDGFLGVEPELIERFCRRIGRTPVIQSYEFSSLIAGLTSGRVDLVSGFMFITPERAKNVLFSDPYYSCSCVCVVRTQTTEDNKTFIQRIANSFRQNLLVENRWRLLLQGLGTTLIVSLFSILLGTLLGMLMCWRACSRHKKLWEGILRVYGAIMHGVPLLVILMLMFYVVFAGTSLTAITIAIITFAISFGYASCEIFRSGIDSVPKGQTEAARSLGFSRSQAFRYIVLPQAVKKIIPFYEGEAVNLIKETSIIGFIAIIDLTKAANIIQSRTFDAFFPLIIISLIYFFLTWLLSFALRKLTKTNA